MSDTQVAPPAPDLKKAKPELGSIVTVLYGWGKIPPKERRTIPASKNRSYRGEGGVYKLVPREVAEEWKQTAIGDFIYILPKDANEVDFVRETGISQDLLKPETTAIVLANINVSDFVDTVGEERALAFAQGILEHLGSKPPSVTSGNVARAAVGARR